MLSGLNFDLIPNDAVGIVALDNNNPLYYQHAVAQYTFPIVRKTDTEIELSNSTTMNHDSYLGAIVSSDRETVFWVNETRPLP